MAVAMPPELPAANTQGWITGRRLAVGLIERSCIQNFCTLRCAVTTRELGTAGLRGSETTLRPLNLIWVMPAQGG